MSKKREPKFCGYVIEDGVRRRARHEELALAWRLWDRHRAIRKGLVKA
jgi:hypothetical protein